ncbi:MAG: PHB depolymerase family esterase [Halobacteriovoraceae bacterium]|nr:PHB depolymerase family esterase [Halobacteriovoraceae bacterium]
MNILRLAILFLAVVHFSQSSEVQAKWMTLNHQGSSVYLYKPSTLGSTDKPSLMVNLHGCAQKGKVLRDHGNWKSAADAFKTIIIIPEVPKGGVIAGCWDYYGLNHNRSNRHNGFILSLVSKIIGLYNINENQIYISGLSSGGGLSMVLGCLAPDIFAGVALNAAPSVGTRSSEVSRSKMPVEEIKANCLKLAGDKSTYLRTQIAALIFGDNDFLVDPEYNRKNAGALSEIFQATGEEKFDLNLLKGTHTQGLGTLYKNKGKDVVSLIENKGLGHNWPAGSGGRPASFVSKQSVNFPYYLLKFLNSNNRRP